MFCPQCGTGLPDNAKFCLKCGKPIPVIEETPAQPPTLAEVVDASAPPPETPKPSKSSQLTGRQRFYLGFLFFCLIGSMASVLIPAFTGEYADYTKNGGGMMFAWGLTFWYLWKLRNRRGWVGACIGVAAFFVFAMVGGGITGYVRGQPEYVLDHTQPFPAIKKHFPAEVGAMKAEIVDAARGQKVTTDEVLALMNAKLMPLMSRALRTTSDDAMLLVARAKISALQDAANSSPTDCVTLLTGDVKDPALRQRLAHLASAATSALNKEATQKVFEDADSYHQVADSAKSDTRLRAILDQLDNTLTRKYSLSVYDATDSSLNKPADVRCQAGLAMYQEALKLHASDRAFLLRRLFGS